MWTWHVADKMMGNLSIIIIIIIIPARRTNPDPTLDQLLILFFSRVDKTCRVASIFSLNICWCFELCHLRPATCPCIGPKECLSGLFYESDHKGNRLMCSHGNQGCSANISTTCKVPKGRVFLGQGLADRK